jgi:hypothetical protein
MENLPCIYTWVSKKKGKIIPAQAVETLRVVRG